MKGYLKIMLIALLVLTVLGFALAEEKLTVKPGSEEKPSVKPIKCCIAGKYEGISKDYQNCPYGPKTEKFTMVIEQTECGSAVYGKVINSATGSPDEKCVHEVKAKICRSATGKWEVIDGTYNAIAGKCCSGTFSMKQR